MAARIILRVTEGPLSGKHYEFEKHDTFLFGRGADCHAQLPDDDTTASRHHFLLEVNPPHARISDLSSVNGTYINEVRCECNQKVDLKDGDQIRAGKTLLRVEILIGAHCANCSKDIPEEFRSLCRLSEDTYICPSCRVEIQTVVREVHCGNCGRTIDTPVQITPGAGFICETCRQQETSDPVHLLSKILEHQAKKGSSEAAISKIAGYQIQHLLGQGGMGAVYLAQRDQDKKPVAIKILVPRLAVTNTARALFQREIEVIRNLHHPCIVELFDHGAALGGFYFVMEYCPGGSIESFMRKCGGRIPLTTAIEIILEVLEGLSYAHQEGFVHRDIKPQNILLADKSSNLAKVADFGLAKSFEQAGLSGFTATGTSGGTPLFMPREI